MEEALPWEEEEVRSRISFVLRYRPLMAAPLKKKSLVAKSDNIKKCDFLNGPNFLSECSKLLY